MVIDKYVLHMSELTTEDSNSTVSQNAQVKVVIRTQHVFLKWFYRFFFHWKLSIVSHPLSIWLPTPAGSLEGMLFSFGGHDIINGRNLKFLLKKRNGFPEKTLTVGNEIEILDERIPVSPFSFILFKNWLLFLLSFYLISQKNTL